LFVISFADMINRCKDIKLFFTYNRAGVKYFTLMKKRTLKKHIKKSKNDILQSIQEILRIEMEILIILDYAEIERGLKAL
jgi:hypothetical protein